MLEFLIGKRLQPDSKMGVLFPSPIPITFSLSVLPHSPFQALDAPVPLDHVVTRSACSLVGHHGPIPTSGTFKTTTLAALDQSP